MTDVDQNRLVAQDEHAELVEEHGAIGAELGRFETEDKSVSQKNQDRLGFVRKVYGIVFAQLAFTVAFVCICMKFMGVKEKI